MDVQAIRQLILQVKELEAQSRHLQTLISDRIEQLHRTIELPDDNACETLLIFTMDYIDHVPDFLEALNEASRQVGIHRFISPFLDIAEENFMAAITRDQPVSGLDLLLDKAYFAHRLIEEVNDQYLVKTGSTLIPMNMTWANLIVHSILGEKFANALDVIVDKTVDQMMRSQAIYHEEKFREFIHDRSAEEWIRIWSRWNCLSNNLGIELKFTASA
ncbi:hypothetical protein ACTL6P_23485 [Endozoicomonas acroporae]|uniref:hypothetical protein n=1 Tax=Endozoicomonas TaxID=305899 RepID=UPI000C795255|nr:MULTISPECIES: hypothetical protein [Endozoicomonas]WBA81716.1 hypothetical protein O2T12_00620 [Endozoicomonas sp. GU-1]WBA84672.1 hypothetical protein O3276_15430 [Endozoicomonas sp. GU-1]